MTAHLDVAARHREAITRILREYFPGVEVWAYGSRVNGRSHEGSDLDLVLRGPGLTPLPLPALAAVREAFRDSTIPFLIEVRDWARLPDSFHPEISRSHIVLLHG